MEEKVIEAENVTVSEHKCRLNADTLATKKAQITLGCIAGVLTGGIAPLVEHIQFKLNVRKARKEQELAETASKAE